MTPLEKAARAAGAKAREINGLPPVDDVWLDFWAQTTRAALEALIDCTGQIVDEHLDQLQEGDGEAFATLLRLVVQR